MARAARSARCWARPPSGAAAPSGTRMVGSPPSARSLRPVPGVRARPGGEALRHLGDVAGERRLGRRRVEAARARRLGGRAREVHGAGEEVVHDGARGGDRRAWASPPARRARPPRGARGPRRAPRERRAAAASASAKVVGSGASGPEAMLERSSPGTSERTRTRHRRGREARAEPAALQRREVLAHGVEPLDGRARPHDGGHRVRLVGGGEPVRGREGEGAAAAREEDEGGRAGVRGGPAEDRAPRGERAGGRVAGVPRRWRSTPAGAGAPSGSTHSGSRARAPSAARAASIIGAAALPRASTRTGPGGSGSRRERLRHEARRLEALEGLAPDRRALRPERRPRSRHGRTALESPLRKGQHLMAEGSAAPAAKSAGHRRHYLVDRGFQLKYALLMAAAGLAVAGVFGLWLHQAHAQATALLAPDPETRGARRAERPAAARRLRGDRRAPRRRARAPRRRHHAPGGGARVRHGPLPRGARAGAVPAHAHAAAERRAEAVLPDVHRRGGPHEGARGAPRRGARGRGAAHARRRAAGPGPAARHRRPRRSPPASGAPRSPRTISELTPMAVSAPSARTGA